MLLSKCQRVVDTMLKSDMRTCRMHFPKGLMHNVEELETWLSQLGIYKIHRNSTHYTQHISFSHRQNVRHMNKTFHLIKKPTFSSWSLMWWMQFNYSNNISDNIHQVGCGFFSVSLSITQDKQWLEWAGGHPLFINIFHTLSNLASGIVDCNTKSYLSRRGFIFGSQH